MTAHDLRALRAAAFGAILDPPARLVYADALEEEGRTHPAFVAWLRLAPAGWAVNLDPAFRLDLAGGLLALQGPSPAYHQVRTHWGLHYDGIGWFAEEAPELVARWAWRWLTPGDCARVLAVAARVEAAFAARAA